MPRTARTVTFFRSWNTDMAYILGFLWASGSVRIKSTGAHVIEFANKDIDHLIAIANCIGENYSQHIVDAVSQTYRIEFCSKEMYYDLRALGVTENKSTMDVPTMAPEYLSHFARGITDGNGSLLWNAGKPVLQIYAAQEGFLADLADAIDIVTGIPAPHIGTNRATCYLKWSTIRAKCLAAWLYIDNPGLALPRKAAIAEQFLQWQPGKAPQKGTVTERMSQQFASYLPILATH